MEKTLAQEEKLARQSARPTLFGLMAIIIWGGSLPVTRHIEEHLGFLTTVGASFSLTGLLGLANQIRRGNSQFKRKIFRQPALYG